MRKREHDTWNILLFSKCSLTSCQIEKNLIVIAQWTRREIIVTDCEIKLMIHRMTQEWTPSWERSQSSSLMAEVSSDSMTNRVISRWTDGVFLNEFSSGYRVLLLIAILSCQYVKRIEFLINYWQEWSSVSCQRMLDDATGSPFSRLPTLQRVS